MSSDDESVLGEKQQEVLDTYLKALTEKFEQLSKRKQTRPKSFRVSKSQQMKAYHARKRQLEDDVKNMEAALSELREQLSARETEIEQLKQPKQPQVEKRRNFGINEVLLRPEEESLTCFPSGFSFP